MSQRKRLLPRASAAFLAATGLLGWLMVAATPAQASAADCQRYLTDRGYKLTDDRINACANDNGIWCIVFLQNSGVPERHAKNACDLSDN